jgi:hypothetical protein
MAPGTIGASSSIRRDLAAVRMEIADLVPLEIALGMPDNLLAADMNPPLNPAAIV